tara:strand:+ start:1449 stop:1574 length:126 start_codon:yes stop_codon:yes gene_type:complete
MPYRRWHITIIRICKDIKIQKGASKIENAFCQESGVKPLII